MPSLNKRRGVLIAGNWKMHKTLSDAGNLAEEIGRGLPEGDEPQVALFPPAVALSVVAERVAGAKKRMLLGAQNIHFEKEGAFTGEISAEMVLSAGGKAVLCGHSERRHTFGESDETVGRKVARALEAGLTPVLCVGEKLQEREEDRTMEVVSRQLVAGMQEVPDASVLSGIVMAYEPVWAIGTGKTATPSQGQEVHHFLRSELQKWLPDQRAEEILILYGGSVKTDNAAELLAEEDIDGLLVGGASLKADSFLRICQAGC